MSKEAPSGGKSRQQIIVHQSLAARFTSRSLLASSWPLCHDAIHLSARNRTPVYHGIPFSLRAASVQTSLSTPKVRRSVGGVEPCRASNALKSSLKLLCKCYADWPRPGSSPPSNLPANSSHFGSRCLSPCLVKAPANRNRRWQIVASSLFGQHINKTNISVSGVNNDQYAPM